MNDMTGYERHKYSGWRLHGAVQFLTIAPGTISSWRGPSVSKYRGGAHLHRADPPPTNARPPT